MRASGVAWFQNPSWELSAGQPEAYRDAVLPPAVHARLSVEAASPFGWERYVGRDGIIIGVDHFGAFAPGPVVMEHYDSRSSTWLRAPSIFAMPKPVMNPQDHAGHQIDQPLAPE